LGATDRIFPDHKSYERRFRYLRRRTACSKRAFSLGLSRSLALLPTLVTDNNIELFGDQTLPKEYTRLAEKLHSYTGTSILQALSTKVDVVNEHGASIVIETRQEFR